MHGLSVLAARMADGVSFMSTKSTFRGYALSAADLKWIRNQIERLDGFNPGDDELRELIWQSG